MAAPSLARLGCPGQSDASGQVGFQSCAFHRGVPEPTPPGVHHPASSLSSPALQTHPRRGCSSPAEEGGCSGEPQPPDAEGHVSPRGFDTPLGTLVPGRGSLPGCRAVWTPTRGWASRPSRGGQRDKRRHGFPPPSSNVMPVPLESSMTGSVVPVVSVQWLDQGGHLHAGCLVCLFYGWVWDRAACRAIR